MRFASNVRAPYFLVAAFAPGMAARGSGSIVNISSMSGRVGLAAGAAYGATKGALEPLTRAWAAEFSPSGVRINAVAPGPVYTDGSGFRAHHRSWPDHPDGPRRHHRRDRGAGQLPRLAAGKLRHAVFAPDGGRTAI